MPQNVPNKGAIVYSEGLSELIELLRHNERVLRQVSFAIPACKDVADTNARILEQWKGW